MELGNGDMNSIQGTLDIPKAEELDSISIKTTPKNLFKKEKSIKKGWIDKWRRSLQCYEKLCLILYRKRLVLCKHVNKKFLFIGYMNLGEIDVKRVDDPEIFIIMKKGTYVIKFRASTEDECVKWVNAISTAKSRLISLTKCEVPDSNSQMSQYFKVVQKGIGEIENKLEQFDSCAALINDQCDVLQSLFSQILNPISENNFNEILKEIRSKTALFLYYGLALRTSAFQFLTDVESQKKNLKKIMSFSLQTNSSLTFPKCQQISESNSKSVELRGSVENKEKTKATFRTSFSQLQQNSSNEASPFGCFEPIFPLMKNTITERRTSIPKRPYNTKIEFWETVKNIIKKKAIQGGIPVMYHEPISYLQYINFPYQYSYLLDKAADSTDSKKQLAYVSAFVVSCYSTHQKRLTKPFVPLLGETFEMDRVADLNWRSLSECVDHRPLTIAHYCKGKSWLLRQTIVLKTKFLGRMLNFIPEGTVHLHFCRTNDDYNYTWDRIPSAINNVFTGEPWIEYEGDVKVTNMVTKEICNLNFLACREEEPFLVVGNVKDSSGEPQWVLKGVYTYKVEGAKVFQQYKDNGQVVLKANVPEVLWQKPKDGDESGVKYYFTKFECQLNEMEPLIAPTDSRMRPDIRALEEGNVQESNKWHQYLESKQGKLLQIAECSSSYEPLWFGKKNEEGFTEPFYQFKGKYWMCKATQSWEPCPDIYL